MELRKATQLAAWDRVRITYDGRDYTLSEVPLEKARSEYLREQSTAQTAKERAVYWKAHIAYCEQYDKHVARALPAKARLHLEALAAAAWPVR